MQRYGQLRNMQLLLSNRDAVRTMHGCHVRSYVRRSWIICGSGQGTHEERHQPCVMPDVTYLWSSIGWTIHLRQRVINWLSPIYHHERVMRPPPMAGIDAPEMPALYEKNIGNNDCSFSVESANNSPSLIDVWSQSRKHQGRWLECSRANHQLPFHVARVPAQEPKTGPS